MVDKVIRWVLTDSYRYITRKGRNRLHFAVALQGRVGAEKRLPLGRYSERLRDVAVDFKSIEFSGLAVNFYYSIETI